MHIQACAFRDSYEKFKKAGAEVVGISGDDPSSHKVTIINNFNPYFTLKNLPISNITHWLIKDLPFLHG